MDQSVVLHRFLPWAVSGGLSGVVVLMVLTAQVVVPLTALVATEVPTRGGFQMYSGMGGIKAAVVSTSGEVDEVDLEAVTADFRPELDYTTRLPTYLCATVADAAEIKMTQSGTPTRHEWTVACGR